MIVLKIKYLTDDALAQCRQNSDIIFKEVISSGRKSLSQLFHEDKLIKEMSLEMPEIHLDMSEKKPYLTDARNVEIVYEAMQGLTDSQASEEKLWIAYTLHEQRDYMKYRWPAQDANAMKNHYFFSYGPHRSLYRNGMSRLWWLGRMTKDTSRKNPYELTKFVCKHPNISLFICEQFVCQQPSIIHGVIRAMYDLNQAFEQEKSNNVPLNACKGVHIDKSVIKDLGKYLNLLSGTYLLDMFEENKIYDIAYNHMRKFVRNINYTAI